MRSAAILAAVLAAFAAGCSKEAERAGPRRVFEPVRIASAYIAMAEKPDATRALLVGDGAVALSPYFDRAGVRPCLELGGKFDIVVLSCRGMTAESCSRAAKHCSENGIVVWLMDMNGVSAAEFGKMLASFTMPQTHLWMPGERDWVLVGRAKRRTVKLSSMFELFSREGTFGDLAAAECNSLPALFASYAGRREDVAPALSIGDMTAEVRPEFFLTREIPKIDWISGEGVDEDILSGTLAEIRSMQVVRRIVVEGSMLSLKAADRKGEEAATEKWSAAAKRNPGDLFLLERLDRLERNAKGFLEVKKVLQAMKCYETMVLIRPTQSSVHNFGMCLKMIGKADLAEKVLKRAEAMGK